MCSLRMDWVLELIKTSYLPSTRAQHFWNWIRRKGFDNAAFSITCISTIHNPSRWKHVCENIEVHLYDSSCHLQLGIIALPSKIQPVTFQTSVVIYSFILESGEKVTVFSKENYLCNNYKSTTSWRSNSWRFSRTLHFIWLPLMSFFLCIFFNQKPSDSEEEPFRFPEDHDIFQKLECILIQGNSFVIVID